MEVQPIAIRGERQLYGKDRYEFVGNVVGELETRVKMWSIIWAKSEYEVSCLCLRIADLFHVGMYYLLEVDEYRNRMRAILRRMLKKVKWSLARPSHGIGQFLRDKYRMMGDGSRNEVWIKDGR